MKLLILFLLLQSNEPKDQVNKFYDWYLKMIESKEIYKLVTPANNNGQAQLKFQAYIDSLKNLNTFHQEFFNSELRILNNCSDFLSNWTWEKYQWEEPSYESHCGFLDYYRWFWTQEPVTNIEITKQEITGTRAIVVLDAINKNMNYRVTMNYKIQIELINEGGNWLITKITNYRNGD